MEMNELHQTMGRVEAKVDMVLIALGAHDHRISVVEKRQWVSIGAFAIGTALLLPRLKEMFEPIAAALAH